MEEIVSTILKAIPVRELIMNNDKDIPLCWRVFRWGMILCAIGYTTNALLVNVYKSWI